MNEILKQMAQLDSELGVLYVSQNRKPLNDRAFIQDSILSRQEQLRVLMSLAAKIKSEAEQLIIDTKYTIDLVKEEIEIKEES